MANHKMLYSKSKKFWILALTALILLTVQVAICSAEVIEDSSTLPNTLFKDVPQTDPNAPYIKNLLDKGIISGYPDGTFGPDKPLSRAEAVAILVRGAGLKIETPATASFGDVPTHHWASPYIETAVQAGVIRGYTDGTFRPDTLLTRAESMTLLFRWSKQDIPEVNATVISDVTSANWAYKTVCAALDAKLLSLSPEGMFYPDQPNTRKDFARGTAITMVLSPAYNSMTLKATLIAKKGTITAKTIEGEQVIKDTLAVKEGTAIKTSPSSEAELVFEDGSGIKIMENTELTVNKLGGCQTIRKDGKPIIAVDDLNIKIDHGQIFGDLASHYDLQKQDNGKKENGQKLVASTLNFSELIDLLAINTSTTSSEQLPWWKSTTTKKVKVTVDMPWGVAGIRGTFWMNKVDNKENVTNVLYGDATVTSNGQAVTMVGGQFTSITSAQASPTTPKPITKDMQKEWKQVENWVKERAAAIELAETLNLFTDQQTSTQQDHNLTDDLISAIENTSSTSSGGGGGGSSSNTGTTITVTPGVVKATLRTANYDPLAGKEVKFYLSQKDGDTLLVGSGITDSTGMATCTINSISLSYTPGHQYYEIVAKFSGDAIEGLDPSMDSEPYSNTSLELKFNESTDNYIDAMIGQTVTAKVYLKYAETPLANQTVELRLQNYPESNVITLTTDDTGRASYDLTEFLTGEGSWNFSATFNGNINGNYLPSNAWGHISLYSETSTGSKDISLEDISVSADASEVRLECMLNGFTTSDITAATFIILENGTEYLKETITPDESVPDKVYFDAIISSLPVGNYNWEVTLSSETDGPMVATAKLLKGGTSISFSNWPTIPIYDVSTIWLEQYSPTLTLTDKVYTNGIADKSLMVYIKLSEDSEFTQTPITVVTDLYGKAIIDLGEISGPGHYQVKATFSGDTLTYASTEEITDIYVGVPQDRYVNLQYYNNEPQLVTVLRERNTYNSIIGRTVKFYIDLNNDNTFGALEYVASATTDTGGNAKLTLTPDIKSQLDPYKYYMVKAVFEGDNNYAKWEAYTNHLKFSNTSLYLYTNDQIE